ATLICLHLVCCGLLFLLVRRRVGRPVALFMSSLLLFLGVSWQDLLAPFQISFLMSLACGLLALLCIDRSSRASNLTAAVLLVLSVASSGVGIPFVAAATVWILARPQRWSTIWIVAPVGL